MKDERNSSQKQNQQPTYFISSMARLASITLISKLSFLRYGFRPIVYKSREK